MWDARVSPIGHMPHVYGCCNDRLKSQSQADLVNRFPAAVIDVTYSLLVALNLSTPRTACLSQRGRI
jgi:hypothetical protein